MKFLASPALLSRSEVREELFLYLAVFSEVVSLVLVRADKDGA